MVFEINKSDAHSNARAGTITTQHGQIATPIFMPVGTNGAVKAVHRHELANDIKAQIILGNTYHLYLRPGLEVIKAAGGLHAFTGWQRPMLTDSGGYQVYSLATMRKITPEGVKFQSHIDGSRHLFTPENVMDTQRIIGADFIMAFDECTPYPCEYPYAQNSMHLTHAWLQRCITRFNQTQPLYGYQQTLMPIVQGSTYPDLRTRSAEFIAQQNCPANAIGGLSVGEPAADMYAMTDLVCQILPHNKPRYLMGVGTPENILESIALGIDMFDCVLPTRNARHGLLYTWQGVLHIKNKQWERDFTPIDAQSTTPTSQYHTKAYLRHLFKAGEMLGPQLASLHNLGFYLDLVTQARQQILSGNFTAWKAAILPKLRQKLGS
ncbi:MAG: tRNA guanosine(34) transglycosylase Tgt [Sphingobacteriales bacterium]|nr:tRNA guanosine(34) transglycosylase Tgt [Sphingobacteriales bacterium]MBK6888808.1 tRNA guanosine(34) transglycosylase Tgt [Sphingobacteriales bacterium]MBK7528685.1 tRNA guanosine(34) transglycosylase Tgt [Sphingobacteriales bacterium]MBP9141106.1 tRNA guanosine(34) transglycosylase Tgt [Chitinophagales bacterium]